MSKVRVSFILGILNAERTLHKCLNGILKQNFPKDEYEILIIDGGSEDSTLDIVSTYMRHYNNIHLFHNPRKLSEGKGMSKDIGVEKSKGGIVIFIDHDNIISDKEWLKKMLVPFKDKKIMASQSLLEYRKDDGLFLKYVNRIGVEDPFAVPYSLVSQVVLNPQNFELVDGKYYTYDLDYKKDVVLFGGANGCAFRKKVFEIIGGYTRDVDVFASMSEYKMKVAVCKDCKVYHKTASNMLQFLKKKAIYFYRFIKNDYSDKKYRWIPNSQRGKIKFMVMVMYNLSFFGPLIFALKESIKRKESFWLLHPFYLFYMTLFIYIPISLIKMRNFLKYI